MTVIHEVLAEAFRYPAPGRLETLSDGLGSLPEGAAKTALARFVGEVGAGSLAEWEELHTRTLDLSPLFAPYVGYAIWGENYKRGAFMVEMSRALGEAGVPLEGELPDHLEPVLRYLARAEAPMTELLEMLPKAIQKMRAALEGAESTNPYLHLLEATHLATRMAGVSEGGAS
jgi:nitrate reductase delta subunit